MNEKTSLIGALGAVGAMGVASYFLFDRFMWRKIDLSRLLDGEIRKKGGTLLSVEETGRFETGPFPKVELKSATADNPAVISTVIPMGNKTFHKKVHWSDQAGKEKTSWARLDFVPFYRLRSIEWRDDV